MRTVRNVTFVMLAATMVYAGSAELFAYYFDNFGFVGTDAYVHFQNGTGEQSCADMVGVCESYCGEGTYSPSCEQQYATPYENTTCADGGGDPPNTGYCICDWSEVPPSCGGPSGGGTPGCYQDGWGCGLSTECCGGSCNEFFVCCSGDNC